MPFKENREATFPSSCERIDLLDRDEAAALLHMIDFAKVNPRLREPLYQLHQYGPLTDGDVISKSARNELLEIGACAKVVVKGEDGFQACTYFGRRLYRIYEWMYGEYSKH